MNTENTDEKPKIAGDSEKPAHKPRKQRPKFVDFQTAKGYAQKQGIKSFSQWFDHCREGKRPDAVPSDPRLAYSDSWTGWGEFLGTGRVSNHHKTLDWFMSYEEAKAIAHEHKITKLREWREWAKTDNRPSRMPSSPNVVYKDVGWSGWNDFLAPKFLPYEEAREIVRSYNLKGTKEWRSYSTNFRPQNIPSNPQKVYKEWTNLQDWLGSGRKPRAKSKPKKPD